MVVLISNFGLFFVFLRGREEKKPEDGQSMLLIQNQMQELTRSVNTNIKEIIEKVTRVDETGKQMVGFAEQLEGVESKSC